MLRDHASLCLVNLVRLLSDIIQTHFCKKKKGKKNDDCILCLVIIALATSKSSPPRRHWRYQLVDAGVEDALMDVTHVDDNFITPETATQWVYKRVTIHEEPNTKQLFV